MIVCQFCWGGNACIEGCFVSAIQPFSAYTLSPAVCLSLTMLPPLFCVAAWTEVSLSRNNHCGLAMGLEQSVLQSCHDLVP